MVSRLNDRNLILAINAVALVRYGTDVLKWTEREIRKMNRIYIDVQILTAYK